MTLPAGASVRAPVSAMARIALALVALTASLPAQAGHRRAEARHAAPPAHAAAVRPERDKAIEKLAPETRLEQRCNARAMGAIGREHPDLAPDELVAYAFADPATDIDADTIKAPGAAVRSRGHWYHLAYDCRTSSDGLDVLAFSYALGDVVPRGDWDAHYLVP